MHVIVVGCGRVGSGLAVALVKAGRDVVLVDKNASAFRRMPKDWGGKELVGSGFDRGRLEEAGAESAIALAAVTSGDNTNILTARIARENFEIPAVVARIYDPRRAEIYQRLGIPTVATVTWTIDRVIHKLFPDESPPVWQDGTGTVRIVERAVPSAWCGKLLSDIEKVTGARIVTLTRGHKVLLGAEEVFGQEGDLLHLAVDASAEQRLIEHFSNTTNEGNAS